MSIFGKNVARCRVALSALALASVLASSPLYAASQGSAGTTSTGSVTISASVPNRVRISGLSDVSMLNQDPASDALSAQDVCVWSNTVTKGYSITATGSGAGNAFTLAAGASTVAYSVEWNGSSGQSSGTALGTGSAQTGFVSTATQQLCSSGPSASASLIIKVAGADLATMQAAQTYTGTLTLLVTPE